MTFPRSRPAGALSLALLLAVSLSLSFSLLPARAEAPGGEGPACAAPKVLVQLGITLPRLTERIASGGAFKVVAVGSSSTAGAGASSPARSYPSRLEAELRAHFPGATITVLNRGVNGEEAPDMLARFDTAVLAERPDLVLWQVGTNSVLRNHAASGVAPLIREGLRRLRASGADVVLIDPQFAPKVISKPDAEAMVGLIGAEAKAADAGLFQRFAIMRDWRERQAIPFATLLSPDELHMNDWSYACVAHLLADAIANAMHAPTVARVPGGLIGQ